MFITCLLRELRRKMRHANLIAAVPGSWIIGKHFEAALASAISPCPPPGVPATRPASGR